MLRREQKRCEDSKLNCRYETHQYTLSHCSVPPCCIGPMTPIRSWKRGFQFVTPCRMSAPKMISQSSAIPRSISPTMSMFAGLGAKPQSSKSACASFEKVKLMNTHRTSARPIRMMALYRSAFPLSHFLEFCPSVLNCNNDAPSFWASMTNLH